MDLSSHPETSPHAGNVYLLYGFRSGIQQALFDQLKAARLAQLATRGMVLQELSFATAFAFGAIGRFISTMITCTHQRDTHV